jgi:hypothetical protein
MKRILFCLLALAIGMTASAQYSGGRYGGGHGRPGGYGHGYGPSNYRPRPGGYGYMYDGAFEVGIMFNHFSKAGDTYRPDRVGFFGEYRMDINPVVDLGLQLSTTFGKGSYSTNGEPYGPDAYFWQGAPLVVTDFNLFPYSGFNPYFGLGVGPGFGYEKNEFKDSGEWTQALVLSPRCGFELFECLRISVHYQWYLSNWSTFSHIGFGISWAFNTMGRGGRPIRR